MFEDSTQKQTERGAAIIETALVLPLLLLFLMGVIDLSAALQEHQKIANISFEGSRYGATLLGLNIEAAEKAQDPTKLTPRHEQIRDRVNVLLESYGYDPASAAVEVVYHDSTQTLEVSVELPYETYFSGNLAPINLDRIKAANSSPYLYPSQP